VSDEVKEWDEQVTPDPAPAASNAALEPRLFFGSVDEFVRERLRYTYARRVGPQGPNRWSAKWWKSPEAISRLDALWRSWEALRLQPTFGMSVWWRDHADHHMRMLMSPKEFSQTPATPTPKANRFPTLPHQPACSSTCASRPADLMSHRPIR